MDLPSFPQELLEGAKALLGAMLPAAIGAAVAQAWEKGLSLRDRLLQWVVGISVSYYVTLGAKGIFHFNDFFAQGLAFVLAMIAFKSTPGFIEGCKTVFAAIPSDLREAMRQHLNPAPAAPKTDPADETAAPADGEAK